MLSKPISSLYVGSMDFPPGKSYWDTLHKPKIRLKSSNVQLFFCSTAGASMVHRRSPMHVGDLQRIPEISGVHQRTPVDADPPSTMYAVISGVRRRSLSAAGDLRRTPELQCFLAPPPELRCALTYFANRFSRWTHIPLEIDDAHLLEGFLISSREK